MELTERDTVMIRTLDRVHRIDLSALHKPLTKLEFHLLAFVCRSGDRGVSVSQAAENMVVPMSAVSRLLNTMEEKGLVARSINRRDRRSITITALPAGQELLARSEDRICRFMSEILGQVSEEDFNALITRWNALLDIMQETFPKYEKEETE